MSSLIDSISMGPFGSDVKVEYMVNEGVPFLDGSNLALPRMNVDSLKFVTREKADSLKNALAHPNDIVVTHRGTIGQISFIPDDLGYDEFLISQSQFRVTLDANKVDPVFFTYYFHTKEGQKRLLSFANYVGVPALASATTNFKDLEFPLIPLSAQKRIAQMLLLIDNKIRNNNAICADLEAMAKLFYDYWFVQFDFPDENGKPYKSSGGKMVWNEELKREIPEGWEVKRLDSVIKLERGISYSSSDLAGNGIPMINLGSFAVGGGYKDDNLKYYSGEYSESKVIKPYDLILCLTQQTDIDPKKDVIGCAMLIPNIFCGDIVISQDLAKVVCTEALKHYLIRYFNTSYYHKYITGYATGSKILHLDVNGILGHVAIIPPHHILEEYANAAKDIWNYKSICLAEIKQLASLRDFLLPMLMNGQVKIGKAGA